MRVMNARVPHFDNCALRLKIKLLNLRKIKGKIIPKKKSTDCYFFRVFKQFSLCFAQTHTFFYC